MLTRLTAAAAMLLLGACVPLSSTPVNDHWIDAWGASFLPTLRNDKLDPVPTFSRQTLRLVILSRLHGTRARVKFTNRFQHAPLDIGAARIALREGAHGGTIRTGTDRALLFAGRPAVTLAPGEEISVKVLRIDDAPRVRPELESEQRYWVDRDTEARLRVACTLTHRHVDLPHHQLRHVRGLGNLSVFHGFQQATNFPVTPEEANILLTLVGECQPV